MTNDSIKKSIDEFVQQDVSLILKGQEKAIPGYLMNLSKEGDAFYFRSEDDLFEQTYRLNELQGIEKNGSKYLFE